MALFQQLTIWFTKVRTSTPETSNRLRQDRRPHLASRGIGPDRQRPLLASLRPGPRPIRLSSVRQPHPWAGMKASGNAASTSSTERSQDHVKQRHIKNLQETQRVEAVRTGPSEAPAARLRLRLCWMPAYDTQSSGHGPLPTRAQLYRFVVHPSDAQDSSLRHIMPTPNYAPPLDFPLDPLPNWKLLSRTADPPAYRFSKRSARVLP